MDNYMAGNQEQEIDLVSLFFAVAHKYKQMAAAAVICAVLFGALGSAKYLMDQHAIAAAQAEGNYTPPPYQCGTEVRGRDGRVPQGTDQARYRRHGL